MAIPKVVSGMMLERERLRERSSAGL